ncbi:hypothetical protein ALO40_101906 [Pseudomonas syringae pv. viburni]|uniref:Uncharacterized protein n=1 Tax=Pseudomonas syringae pv. viburni TaxID=251703 RepID=A0A0Q0D6C0_9PSED|nr:hypothetical protein ALO40_101906 [Pseudomonas syringae pv. viburni]
MTEGIARSVHITRFCPKGVGADLSAMGCEAALKPVTLAVSGTPRRPILLPVPGSSRTSPLLRRTGYRGQAKRRPVRCHTTCFCPQGVGADLSAMGCEAALKPVTLAVSGTPRRPILLPVPGSSRTSPLLQNRDIADERSIARSVHITRFCPQGGADLSAMGCEAALKPVTLAVSGTPRRPILLPVPGSSRTSPLLQNRDIADERSVARSHALREEARSLQPSGVRTPHKTLQTMSVRPYILRPINLHTPKRMSSRALDLSGSGRCSTGLFAQL